MLELWSSRLKHMSSSPNTLEALFAARCCVCYELYSQHGSAQPSPIAPTALGGFRKNWLKFAKIARAAGECETASNAVMQAMITHPLIHACINSFIHSSLINSFMRSLLIHSFMRPFITHHSVIHS